MKISSEITKKEYFKSFNLANNLSKTKKISQKRLMTTSQKNIQYLIICFTLLASISLTNTLINLDWLTNLLFFLFLCLMIYIIWNTIKFIYNYQTKKKKTNQIEIRWNKDGIIDISEENNYIARTWDEVKFILKTEQEILINCQNSHTFILPNQKDINKKLDQILKKYAPSLAIVEKQRPQKFQKHLWNWGIYFLIFLITFGISIFWDYYNTCLLDQEIYKINNNNYQVDEKIYSYEKFGIIEKALKEYFQEFYNAKEMYEQNKASTIFLSITIDKLKNSKEKIPEMENQLPKHEQLATEAINKLIQLLDENSSKEIVEKYQLDKYFENIFKKYAFTEYDYYYLESWKKELAKNEEQMKLVKRAIEILKQENCWYIENDKLYMCNDYLDEYNTIYYDIMNEEKNNYEKTE